jgi:hypothetical protein
MDPETLSGSQQAPYISAGNRRIRAPSACAANPRNIVPVSDPAFDRVLPRLVATYEAGRLVPFIGSGMSRRVITDWAGFVHKLEVAGGRTVRPAIDGKTSRDELIRRANAAVRALKGAEPTGFANAIRAALRSDETHDTAIPTQTQALAEIWWPLVLSTNYDNCFATAFARTFPQRPLAVVGRGSEDCQRVLSSLTTAGRSLLWALQGFLHDTPYDAPYANPGRRLEAQLVVGHEEYRHVTYRDPHFRRAFAEVFRQRSLLFLGAGIQESYLQELFGEVLETFGPATRPHYAFLPKGEVDPDFMRARFQIVVVEYKKKDHGKVCERLKALAEAIRRPVHAPVAWSWGRIDRRDENDWHSVPDLEVRRDPLPTREVEGEALAVSAGGSGGAFYFSSGIRTVMENWGVAGWSDRRPGDTGEGGGYLLPPERRVAPYLGVFPHHVYAVRARSETDERNLAHIYDAALALFTHLDGRYRCVRMQLLATGGTEKQGQDASNWKVRNYPERFSFIQTVRAWAAWRRKNPGKDCRLALHVVLDTVYRDIASGRIDVLELLSCEDIRFFVEVVSDSGELERRLYQAMPDITLRSVATGDLQLSPAHWTVEVTPPPGGERGSLALTAQRLAQSLQSLGVVPGSTVHFRRDVGCLDDEERD